jgi:hypothetical protein
MAVESIVVVHLWRSWEPAIAAVVGRGRHCRNIDFSSTPIALGVSSSSRLGNSGLGFDREPRLGANGAPARRLALGLRRAFFGLIRCPQRFLVVVNLARRRPRQACFGLG